MATVFSAIITRGVPLAVTMADLDILFVERHPCSRTSRRHVVADAKTLPMRWARTARVPVGTCRLSGDVTKSLIVATSLDVTRCGEVFGHDEWSSRSHPRSARFQA